MADTDETTARDRAIETARLFHDTYERLAPQYGYRTREASAKPWDEVPENNRELMIATCAEVLRTLAGAPTADVAAELEYAVVGHHPAGERQIVFTTSSRVDAVDALEDPDIVEVLQRRVGPWDVLDAPAVESEAMGAGLARSIMSDTAKYIRTGEA